MASDVQVSPAQRAAVSRAAQKLPPKVEDPATLARVAALVRAVPNERRWRAAYPDEASNEDRAVWTAAVDRAARNVS